MKTVFMPEDGKNFVNYEVDGNNIDFNEGELTLNVKKRERDYDVNIDICSDYTGALVMGASGGKKYVAQIQIPARKYTEKEIANPNYNEEEGTAETTIVLEPVPFSMENVTLVLWEMED